MDLGPIFSQSKYQWLNMAQKGDKSLSETILFKLKQSKVKWKIVIDRSSSAEDFKASHICKAKKIDYHIDVFE